MPTRSSVLIISLWFCLPAFTSSSAATNTERLTCRDVTTRGVAGVDTSVSWRQPADPSERIKLAEQCKTVGPVVIHVPGPASQTKGARGRILIVGWNVHVGHGRIHNLVEQLAAEESSAGFAPPDFVMLIQEAFRRGPETPLGVPGNVSVPNRIGPPDTHSEIEHVARSLGWWLYYAPSMRNGNEPGIPAEDRGNAILSSMPLEDFAAVELPMSVQRRVSLVATVNDPARSVRFRVAVAHLDTRAPFFSGFIFGGPAARDRQAVALERALREFGDDGLPLFLSGDLNSVFGRSERSVQRLSTFAARLKCEGKPTSRFKLTLDHMFYDRVPPSWSLSRCIRWDDSWNSDHFPLVVPLAVTAEYAASGGGR